MRRLRIGRERMGVLLALASLACLSAALLLTKGQDVLMPGPLASAHGAIESCSGCHAKSGDGKLSWVRGLIPGDPHADSKACLTCHKMLDTAFNAHGASDSVLKQSTQRLTAISAKTPQPRSARAQDAAFPTHDMAAAGLACATCHQEHRGVAFDLKKISNAQCRSCHVVKFDSFDGDHPAFEGYPFARRTQIIYDHAGHFGKHYPELAKKDPARSIPETCSTCHNTRADKRVMAVAPFERTCASCHLDQIRGKERATGPKGIAFLSLPGLDLDTLRTRKATIGEWPDDSEADLTPFMKVMIGRNESGRALLQAVDGLNLKDLTDASDEQIKAATDLAWEIKKLIHALIKGKASDVLGDFNIVSGAALSASLVSDLTAGIPRDVVAAAQQEWLPNLGTEIVSGPISSLRAQSSDNKETSAEAEDGASDAAEESPDTDDAEETASATSEGTADETASVSRRDPPPCLVRLFGQCLMSKEDQAAGDGHRAGKPPLPEPMRAGIKRAPPDRNGKMLVAEAAPALKGGDQSDDLLFPTDEELRAMGRTTGGGGSAKDPAAAPAGTGGGSNAGAQSTLPTATPVIAIESDVDPESWAEYGGWYRQDYAISYRPAGHKDKFIYAWLFLTGPQAPKGATGPAAAVFDVLTDKDAQGSCTKCHSVDDIPGKGRVVNFSPRSTRDTQGRFTHFVHEPHFGLLETRGCLSCHDLEKGRPYLKSFEQGNPLEFASSFGPVKKDLCQTCHTKSKARQDCLLCHDYHVNGVVTPIMQTKIPVQ